jgi:hypothetical protein
MTLVGKEGSATFLETTETYREGARTLPRRYYTDPGIFVEEEDRIFRREWLCVGREEEIASPGEYFLASVAGESLIVVRDETGGAARSSTCAGTAGRGCARRSAAGTRARSSARTTPGRTDSTAG